jgi:alpha-tubulin suppressor-like RCC1 family protein
MAITNSEEGVWGLDEVYNKINQSEWRYGGGDNDTGMWIWGANSSGILGQNQTPGPGSNGASSPVQIPGAPYSNGWKALCGGGGADANYMFGFQGTDTSDNTNGSAWTWGWNTFGQLAADDRVDYSSPKQLPGGNWHYITRGRYTGMGLKTDATLWSWGYNGQGVLGQGQSSHQQRRSSPVRIGSNNDHLPTGLDWKISGGGYPSGTRNRNIQISGYAAFGLKEDNSMWSWGSNNPGGRLGHNNTTSYASPKQIEGPDGNATKNWSHLCTGQRGPNCMAIDLAGGLWGWGTNEKGDLGFNNRTNYSRPKQVGYDNNWTDVCISENHTMGLKSDNTLWAWGRNSEGALGLNEEGDGDFYRSSPTQVPGSWNQMYATYNRTIATKTDGTTWVWGSLSSGGLGQNTVGPSNSGFSSPVQLMGKASATALTGLYGGFAGIFSPPG